MEEPCRWSREEKEIGRLNCIALINRLSNYTDVMYRKDTFSPKDISDVESRLRDCCDHTADQIITMISKDGAETGEDEA